MVADYTVKGDTFTPGRPRQWCETPILFTGIYTPLDLAPDGKRFVVFPAPQSAGPSGANGRVTFLIHFFDELKRRIPPK
jgi:serine/threonine-protein kinase